MGGMHCPSKRGRQWLRIGVTANTGVWSLRAEIERAVGVLLLWVDCDCEEGGECWGVMRVGVLVSWDIGSEG